jgi:hypothetical protein
MTVLTVVLMRCTICKLLFFAHSLGTWVHTSCTRPDENSDQPVLLKCDQMSKLCFLVGLRAENSGAEEAINSPLCIFRVVVTFVASARTLSGCRKLTRVAGGVPGSKRGLIDDRGYS